MFQDLSVSLPLKQQITAKQLDRLTKEAGFFQIIVDLGIDIN